MAQTHEGAMKVLARKTGLSLPEFQNHIKRGLKWCYRCSAWKDRLAFQLDRSRYDGRAAICNQCKHDNHKGRYVPRPRISKKGSRFAPVRDGDKFQARARVNHLVDIGLLPDPDTLPCADCGDRKKRHTYDHYLGYAAAHQEHVEPTCYKCHDKRSRQRGELIQRRNAKGKFTQKDAHGR
jgi:hypothetical protein